MYYENALHPGLDMSSVGKKIEGTDVWGVSWTVVIDPPGNDCVSIKVVEKASVSVVAWGVMPSCWKHSPFRGMRSLFKNQLIF